MIDLNCADDNYLQELLNDQTNFRKSLKGDGSTKIFLHPWKGMMLRLGFINPQQYGPIMEKFQSIFYGLHGFPGADGRSPENDLWELKCSFARLEKIFNIVQVRPDSEEKWNYLSVLGVDATVPECTPYVFCLSRMQVEDECKLWGTSAHGTKSIRNGRKGNEYRFSLNINDEDPHFRRWMDIYYNSDLSLEMLGWSGLKITNFEVKQSRRIKAVTKKKKYVING